MTTTLAPPATNDELLARFDAEYRVYNGVSERRGRVQQSHLREFAATLGGRSLTEATGDDLRAWASHLVASYHVNTVRWKLNLVRPFFSWLYALDPPLIDDQQYVRLRQVKDPDGATGRSTPRPYRPSEIAAMYEILEREFPLHPRMDVVFGMCLRGRARWRRLRRHGMRLQLEAIIALALHTGLRAREIYSAEINHLHFDNRYVWVEHAKGAERRPDKQRAVPFTRFGRERVQEWLEFRASLHPEHDRVWLSLWGQAFVSPMHWSRFGELLSRSLGPGWELHRLRHTCATEWLRAGMPLDKVSRLLGHSTLEQTRAYTEIINADVYKAVSAAESRFMKAVTHDGIQR